MLAQRLFIEKAGLPSPLLNQLKRLAAFQNPEFYKKQKMRLSTALTPRVIACAEELPLFVALPRGCMSEAERLLAEHGVKLAVEDRRHDGAPLELKFDGELTLVQKEGGGPQIRGGKRKPNGRVACDYPSSARQGRRPGRRLRPCHR